MQVQEDVAVGGNSSRPPEIVTWVPSQPGSAGGVSVLTAGWDVGDEGAAVAGGEESTATVTAPAFVATAVQIAVRWARWEGSRAGWGPVVSPRPWKTTETPD